jgi:hypothetical protein
MLFAGFLCLYAFTLTGTAGPQAPDAIPSPTPTEPGHPAQPPEVAPEPRGKPPLTATESPVSEPTAVPGVEPSVAPVETPGEVPTPVPGDDPSVAPIETPGEVPTPVPNDDPSVAPVTQVSIEGTVDGPAPETVETEPPPSSVPEANREGAVTDLSGAFPLRTLCMLSFSLQDMDEAHQVAHLLFSKVLLRFQWFLSSCLHETGGFEAPVWHDMGGSIAGPGACGGLGRAACATGAECGCGLFMNGDGMCEDDGIGCLGTTSGATLGSDGETFHHAADI